MANSAGTRENENRYMRFFCAYYLLVLHAALSIGTAMFIKYYVDGKFAISANTESSRHGYLYVSDFTTMVSACLTALRVVLSGLTADAAWRCAFILLEKPGLTLQEFNRIVTLGFFWPKSPITGYHCMVIAVLFAMIPSLLVAPILTGSVGWEDSRTSAPTEPVQVRYDNPLANPEFWYWFINNATTRRQVAQQAAGASALAWANGNPSDRSCRHTITSAAAMPANSTVENAIIPCLEIHSISWDRIVDKGILDIITNGSRISLLGEDPLAEYHQGNAAAFEPAGNKGWNDYRNGKEWSYGDSRIRARFPTPTASSGAKKVALLITRQEDDCTSRPIEPTMFGDPAKIARLQPLHWLSGNCYRIGTFNFTAGVIRVPSSTYISPRVIKSSRKVDILPDRWVMPALYLLPDVMSRVSGMNSTPAPSWNNMDRYTEELIRQSYMGIWDAMNNLFSNDQVTLTAWKTVGLLEATVDYHRLYAWLAAQLLVTISGIALWLLQMGCDRPIVIDSPAVSLMVNSEVVSRSGNRLTDMSYVSKKDFPGGRLKLWGVGGARGPDPQRFELAHLSASRQERGFGLRLSNRLRSLGGLVR